MRGSTLRAIWPRAESHIYAEIKRLEKAGLASSSVERRGERQRSVYTLTSQGEDALQEWLVESSRRFAYESEALLKVAYAEHGEIDDLRRNIAGIRDEAIEDLEIMGQVFEHIVTHEQKILPKRRAYNALVSRFILEIIEARLRWVEYADAYVADWPDVISDESKEAQGTASYKESLAHLRTLLETWGSR
jgi:PadR family transcriptional regulator AphA